MKFQRAPEAYASASCFTCSYENARGIDLIVVLGPEQAPTYCFSNQRRSGKRPDDLKKAQKLSLLKGCRLSKKKHTRPSEISTNNMIYEKRIE